MHVFIKGELGKKKKALIISNKTLRQGNLTIIVLMQV